MEVGLNPAHIVLDGDPAPPPKKGALPFHPIFGPCLLWPKAGWIKMLLGTEVGVGPDNIVLDGDPAVSQKGAQKGPVPHFSAHVYCGQVAAWSRCLLVWR